MTIRQARWKLGWLLVGLLVFTLLAVWTLSDPNEVSAGLFGTVLFGGAALLCAILIARPASLVISSESLIERGWRTRRWDWHDVSSFRVYSQGRSQLVTFDNAKGKRGIVRSLNLALGAGSDSLTNFWELPPRELAELLNEAKARWG